MVILYQHRYFTNMDTPSAGTNPDGTTESRKGMCIMNKSIESKCDVCFINDKYRGTSECVFCRLSRIEEENADLKKTVSQRNVQVADLKHRLEEKETEIRELKTFWTGNVQ